MSPAVARVLDALRERGSEPREAGKEWKARCPAHEDANPSLSVSEGAEGRALVKCMAGCQTAAVVAALGLRFADLGPPRTAVRGPGRTPEREDVIRAKAGNVVAVHKRFRNGDKKTCFWFGPDGRTPSKKGSAVEIVPAKLPLYGIHDLAPTGAVVIAEGEKAADALRSRDVAAVGTVTGAGGVPCAESLADLAGRDVVLWADHDEPGRKHMARVAAGLRGVAASVRFFGWPDAPPKGDAADFFERGGTVEELRALLDAATDEPPETAEADSPDLPLTDLGFAERFVSAYGDRFRFAAGAWFVWNETHWERGGEGEAANAMGAVVRACGDAAGGDTIRKNAARKHESAGHIAGALKLASSRRPVAVETNDFDRSAFLLNCANGTVDLPTGKLRPHRREDLLTHLVPWNYDATATAPRWERFVSEVMAGRTDLVGFLQRFAGYCLTGDVREQALLFAVGHGRNGKSMFVETLRTVFGPDLAGAAAPKMLLDTKVDRHPTELADLFDKRLVIANEVPRSARFDEERMKSLTGGDTIKARRMRQDFFEFAPTHKFILCANHRPAVKDPSEGFWRRVRVVPFDVDFRGREEKGLLETLRAEAAGILAWCVRGCLAWQAVGLGEPTAVVEATSAYRNDEDALGRFLATEPEALRGAGPFALAAIHAAFKEWAAGEGEPEPRGGRFLAADLERIGWKKARNGPKGAVRWSPPRTEGTEASKGTIDELPKSAPQNVNVDTYEGDNPARGFGSFSADAPEGPPPPLRSFDEGAA